MKVSKEKQEKQKQHLIEMMKDDEDLKLYEEPKQETLEEAAERFRKDKYGIFISKDADVKGQLVINTANAAFLSGMKEGAKWQQERSHSEEEVFNLCREFAIFVQRKQPSYKKQQEWFEQFKKK